MRPPSLTELETALATDALDAWLARIADEALRSRLRRALDLDRRLFRRYPQSVASCLLARTHGDPACAELHAAWIRELDARSTPWIRPLRPLPVPDGLLAELHADESVSFVGVSEPRFLSDDEVVLVAPRRHDDKKSGPAARERLRWAWTRGAVVREPDPTPPETAANERYPRFEHPAWGPSYLVREPGSKQVELPCPEDGSAYARLSADGRKLLIYGTLDEYAGGFVYVVDPDTLAVERQLATESPVSDVIEGSPERMLVTTYRSGTIAWLEGQAHRIAVAGRAFALSPGGTHVASFGAGLQIWSIAELLRRPAAEPAAGFPTRFDPGGDRLLWDNHLCDGRDGRPIATLKPDLHPYLEGGPAQPWLYFGTRHIICSHGSLRVWDARTGKPRKLKQQLGFPHWYALAYDREGSHLAVLHQGESTVALHELPSGRVLRTLTFDLAASAVAMAPDAGAIAVQQAGAVEVRSANGELIGRFGQVAKDSSNKRRSHGGDPLRFSLDGRRLARHLDGDGWRVWSLAGDPEQRIGDDLEQLPDFAPPHPTDWTVQAGTMTLFTHVPTGTRIALPATGRWMCNPANPQIIACDDLHAELRAP